MIMKINIYILLLLLSCFFLACSKEPVVNELDQGVGDEEKKDVILIRMGDGDEVKDVTQRLYNNIPAAWEIREKSIVEYDKLEGDKQAAFIQYIKNERIYVSVIVDIEDIFSGKYAATMFRELKFYKRDFYIIAIKDVPELQKTMLNLIGVYLDPGYYGINYDNLQRYRIFSAQDPYAKDNMIGKGIESFKKALYVRKSTKGDTPDEMYNQQMANKEALKHIEVYNRVYGYAKGNGMDYSVETAAYKAREGQEADIVIDNDWVIDAYNFEIYSKNNNCILSVYNTTGNGFTCNVRDYTTPKTLNVYAYIWNLMKGASSEVTVHSDGNVFRELSYQPQTVNHGSTYSEESAWHVSVSVSPVKLAEAPWEAFRASFGMESSTAVSYKTQTMDLASKGQMGDGLYSKLWQFIPGQFYDKKPAFVYETGLNLTLIDAPQAMTPNYVTWGGYTLRQNYQDGINNSMKLHKQQCIYTLQSDANPGIVSVAMRDAVELQKTEVHYNCGIRYGHQSSGTEMSVAKMVLIDFGQWNN